METRRFKDLDLSVLTLGTVQFGLPYGIANRTGQPPYGEVLAILEAAYAGGVRSLDTAAVYGTSEEVLGRALAELGIRDSMVVTTKVTQIANEGVSAKEADAFVEESVVKSLKNLRLDVLPICLFHLEGNFLRYADSLLKLKERGLVRRAGSSVNFPGPTLEILGSGKAEAVQMPTSILDHRFLRQGVPALAARQGAALFVRSIYLQGLLLMKEEDILPELSAVIPVIRSLQGIAREAGMGMTELAVRYMLSLPGVTSLVVGVDTAAQMRENAAVFGKGPLPADLRARVEQAVPDLPDAILFPGNWPRKMTVEPKKGGTWNERPGELAESHRVPEARVDPLLGPPGPDHVEAARPGAGRPGRGPPPPLPRLQGGRHQGLQRDAFRVPQGGGDRGQVGVQAHQPGGRDRRAAHLPSPGRLERAGLVRPA
jgi:aryl-alcohol dehydrogenase-like predicted oxidoreductase